MFQLFINPLLVLLSLSTTTGVLLHETKIDKLTALAVVSPIVAAKKLASGTLLESMPHTHSEAGSLQSSARELRTTSPGMTPRRDRDEKYRLQKKVPRGYHLFDSYHLPLEAISQ